MLNFLVVACVFSGEGSSGLLSGQGGIWFVRVMGDCDVISRGSARGSSCRLRDLWVCAGDPSNESSCSLASPANNGSFNFVLLVVAVVGLVELSSDISASSV